MSRSAAEWNQRPGVEHVDSRIYTDEALFEQELARIWKKAWVLACHKSELPEVYDFRTLTIAREPVVVCRGEDMAVRAFLNVCPHRGNLIVRSPAGSFKVGDPSGNPKRMTCMFHGWQFDMQGQMRRDSAPRTRLSGSPQPAAERPAELPCTVAYGGFVWVSLDDEVEPLSAFIGPALDIMMTELESEPLEIFHYHKAIIDCNYKLWHDTNSEFYHDYMHYHNSVTSMMQPGYYDRKYTSFPNGHCSVGSMEVKYEAYKGFKGRDLSLPRHCRATAGRWSICSPASPITSAAPRLRIDTMTPISANRVLIEFRGSG